MTGPRTKPVLHHIRHLIGSFQTAAMTDGELLTRFLADRNETAVEAVIRRYGPLVLGVCRRVLHNAHAAEDVFQATFLVLLRKAPSLDRGKPLGGWLYTVAYRLALRARANEARRRQCEAQAARNRPHTLDHARTSDDRVVAVEEELQKLPERHRAPLVLCYLEGMTNEQAAEALGCPRGSVSARLAEAREQLRACLARRGYSIPSAGIATLLAATADAAVPPLLLTNTVHAALWFASAECGAASFISTGAVALATAACRAMFLNKLKIAAAVLLATSMLGTGTIMLLKAAPQDGLPAQTGKQSLAGDRPDRTEINGERLPEGVMARMGTTHLRHGDAVSFATYTPDGRSLVTAGRDKTVRLWDLATGKEIRRFDWDEAAKDTSSQPSRDEIAEKYDQQRWDTLARSCQAALSSDGKMVAASRGGVVGLWETASGKKLRRLQTGQKRLLQLAFAADGKSLLTVGPGQAAAVWEVASGKCLQRHEGQPAPRVRGPLSAIAVENVLVSPGFKYLAFWKQDDNHIPWIHIKDLATDKEQSRIKIDPGTMALAFSADDKTLVWEHHTDAAIIMSDVATGRELRRLKPAACNDSATAGDSVMAIALSADGKSLAVCWMSRTIDLWDLTSGRQSLPAGKATAAQHEQRSNDWWNLLVRPALAFSADGKKLVCSLGGAAIRQFQVDTGAEILAPGNGHRGPVSSLALSADGKSLCTYSPGDLARCWDWMNGKELGHRKVPAGATHAVFATDGRFGFALGHDFTFYGAKGNKTWRIAAEGVPVASLALSPDGAILATRNMLHEEVHLWDTTTGKKRPTLGRPAAGEDRGGTETEATGILPRDLVFSPDGRFLAATGPGRQLCLWHADRGTVFWQILPKAGQSIERFAFSPSGRMLASVNTDRTVTLYEAASGMKRGRLGQADPLHRKVYLSDGGRSIMDEAQIRRDAPVCLAFSPDSRYLATAQHTPDIHLWDVLASREIGQLKRHQGGVVGLLFTQDGKHLISAGTDTTALTWDLTPLLPPIPGPGPRLEPLNLDALWRDLADNDASRAFGAIRKLSVSADQAVTLIKERLRPASPPDPDRLARLLADMQSNHFKVRRQAESELEGLADLAESALRAALDKQPPLDLRLRVQRLLDKISGQVHAPSLLRDLRAVELLELMDTSQSRRVLQSLAGGLPGASLTRAAENALWRLSKQAVTP